MKYLFGTNIPDPSANVVEYADYIRQNNKRKAQVSAQNLRDFSNAMNKLTNTVEYLVKKRQDSAEYDRLTQIVNEAKIVTPVAGKDTTPTPSPAKSTTDVSGAARVDSTTPPVELPETDVQKAYNTWYDAKLADAKKTMDAHYADWYAAEQKKIQEIIKANFDKWSADRNKVAGGYSEETYNVWYLTQQAMADKIMQEDYDLWRATETAAVNKIIEDSSSSWYKEYVSKMPSTYTYKKSDGTIVTGTYEDVSAAALKETDNINPNADALKEVWQYRDAQGKLITLYSKEAKDKFEADQKAGQAAEAKEWNKYIYKAVSDKKIMLKDIPDKVTWEGTGEYAPKSIAEKVTWKDTGRTLSDLSAHTKVTHTGRYAPKGWNKKGFTPGFTPASTLGFDISQSLSFKLKPGEYVDPNTLEVLRNDKQAPYAGSSTLAKNEKVVGDKIFASTTVPGYTYIPEKGYKVDAKTGEILKKITLTGEAALNLKPNQVYIALTDNKGTDLKSGYIYERTYKYNNDPESFKEVQVIPDDYVNDRGVRTVVDGATILVPVDDKGLSLYLDNDGSYKHTEHIASSIPTDTYKGIVYFKPIGQRERFDPDKYAAKELINFVSASVDSAEDLPDWAFIGTDGKPHVKGRSDDAPAKKDSRGNVLASGNKLSMFYNPTAFLDVKEFEHFVEPPVELKLKTQAEYFNARAEAAVKEAEKLEEDTRYLVDPNAAFATVVDFVLNFGADYVQDEPYAEYGHNFKAEVVGRIKGIGRTWFNTGFGEMTGYHYEQQANGTYKFIKGKRNWGNVLPNFYNQFVDITEVTNVLKPAVSVASSRTSATAEFERIHHMSVGNALDFKSAITKETYEEALAAIAADKAAVKANYQDFFGVNPEHMGVRKISEYNTGNGIANFVLEVIADPANIASFGGSGAVKSGAKALLVAGREDVVKAVIKSADDDTLKVVAKGIVRQAGMGVDDIVAGASDDALRAAFRASAGTTPGVDKAFIKSVLEGATRQDLLDTLVQLKGTDIYDSVVSRIFSAAPDMYRSIITNADPTLLKSVVSGTAYAPVYDIAKRIDRVLIDKLYKGVRGGDYDVSNILKDIEVPHTMALARNNADVYGTISEAYMRLQKIRLSDNVVNNVMKAGALMYNVSEGLQRGLLYIGLSPTPILGITAFNKVLKVAGLQLSEITVLKKNLNRISTALNSRVGAFKEAASREVVEAMAKSSGGSMPLAALHMLKDLVEGDYKVFGSALLKDAIVKDNISRFITSGNNYLGAIRLAKYAGAIETYNKLRAAYFASNGYESETLFMDALDQLAKRSVKVTGEVPVELETLIDDIKSAFNTVTPDKVSDVGAVTVEDVLYARDYLLSSGDTAGAVDLDRVAKGMGAALNNASKEDIDLLIEYKAINTELELAQKAFNDASDYAASIENDPGNIRAKQTAEANSARLNEALDIVRKKQDVLAKRTAKIIQDIGDSDVTEHAIKVDKARLAKAYKKYRGALKKDNQTRAALLEKIDALTKGPTKYAAGRVDEAAVVLNRLIEIEAQYKKLFDSSPWASEENFQLTSIKNGKRHVLNTSVTAGAEEVDNVAKTRDLVKAEQELDRVRALTESGNKVALNEVEFAAIREQLAQAEQRVADAKAALASAPKDTHESITAAIAEKVTVITKAENKLAALNSINDENISELAKLSNMPERSRIIPDKYTPDGMSAHMIEQQRTAHNNNLRNTVSKRITAYKKLKHQYYYNKSQVSVIKKEISNTADSLMHARGTVVMLRKQMKDYNKIGAEIPTNLLKAHDAGIAEVNRLIAVDKELQGSLKKYQGVTQKMVADARALAYQEADFLKADLAAAIKAQKQELDIYRNVDSQFPRRITGKEQRSAEQLNSLANTYEKTLAELHKYSYVDVLEAQTRLDPELQQADGLYKSLVEKRNLQTAAHDQAALDIADLQSQRADVQNRINIMLEEARVYTDADSKGFFDKDAWDIEYKSLQDFDEELGTQMAALHRQGRIDVTEEQIIQAQADLEAAGSAAQARAAREIYALTKEDTEAQDIMQRLQDVNNEIAKVDEDYKLVSRTGSSMDRKMRDIYNIDHAEIRAKRDYLQEALVKKYAAGPTPEEVAHYTDSVMRKEFFNSTLFRDYCIEQHIPLTDIKQIRRTFSLDTADGQAIYNKYTKSPEGIAKRKEVRATAERSIRGRRGDVLVDSKLPGGFINHPEDTLKVYNEALSKWENDIQKVNTPEFLAGRKNISDKLLELDMYKARLMRIKQFVNDELHAISGTGTEMLLAQYKLDLRNIDTHLQALRKEKVDLDTENSLLSSRNKAKERLLKLDSQYKTAQARESDILAKIQNNDESLDSLLTDSYNASLMAARKEADIFPLKERKAHMLQNSIVPLTDKYIPYKKIEGLLSLTGKRSAETGPINDFLVGNKYVFGLDKAMKAYNDTNVGELIKQLEEYQYLLTLNKDLEEATILGDVRLWLNRYDDLRDAARTSYKKVLPQQKLVDKLRNDIFEAENRYPTNSPFMESYWEKYNKANKQLGYYKAMAYNDMTELAHEYTYNIDYVLKRVQVAEEKLEKFGYIPTASLYDDLNAVRSSHKVIYRHGLTVDSAQKTKGFKDIKVHQLKLSNKFVTESWIRVSNILSDKEALMEAFQKMDNDDNVMLKYLKPSMCYTEQLYNYAAMLDMVKRLPLTHPEFFNGMGIMDATTCMERYVVDTLHNYFELDIEDAISGVIKSDIRNKIRTFGSNAVTHASFISDDGIRYFESIYDSYVKDMVQLKMRYTFGDVKFTPSFSKLQGQMRRLGLELERDGFMPADNIIFDFNNKLKDASARIRKTENVRNDYYIVTADGKYLNPDGGWEEFPTDYKNPYTYVAAKTDMTMATKIVADSDKFQDWFNYGDVEIKDFFLLEELTHLGTELQDVVNGIQDAGDNIKYLHDNYNTFYALQSEILRLLKTKDGVSLLPEKFNRLLFNDLTATHTPVDDLKQYAITHVLFRYLENNAGSYRKQYAEIMDEFTQYVNGKQLFKVDEPAYSRQWDVLTDAAVDPGNVISNAVGKGGPAHVLDRANSVYRAVEDYSVNYKSVITENKARGVRELLALPNDEKVQLILSDLDVIVENADNGPYAAIVAELVRDIKVLDPGIPPASIVESYLKENPEAVTHLLMETVDYAIDTKIYDSRTQQLLSVLRFPANVSGQAPMKIISTTQLLEELADGKYLGDYANSNAAKRVARGVRARNLAQHNTEQANIIIDTLDKTPEQMFSHLSTEVPGFVIINTMLDEASGVADAALVKFLANVEGYENLGIGIARTDASNGVPQFVIYLKKESTDFKRILHSLESKTYGSDMRVASYLLEDSTDVEKLAYSKYVDMHKRLQGVIQGDIHSSTLLTLDSVEAMYQALPLEVRTDMITPIEFQRAGFFSVQHYDVANLGGYDYRKVYNPYVTEDVGKGALTAALRVNERMGARAAFANTFIDKDSPMCFNTLYDATKHSDDEVIQSFRDHPYLVGVYMIDKPDPILGVTNQYAEIMHITNKRAYNAARSINPVIMGVEEASRVVKAVNTAATSNHISVELMRTMSSVIKAAYLSTPGWIMRNVISSVTKSLITSDIRPGDFPMRMAFMGDSFKNLHTYDKFMREIYDLDTRAALIDTLMDPLSGQLSTTDLSKLIHSSPALRELMTKPEYAGMENVFQEIYHFVHNSSMSITKAEALGLEHNGYIHARGLVDSVKDIELRAKKIYNLAEDVDPATLKLYEAQLAARDVAWKNWYTRSLTDINSNIEAYLRYDTYRWERYWGANYHEASSMVTYTHFDYGDVSKFMSSAEVMVPFINFKLTNTLFWLDIMNKRPEVARAYMSYLRTTGAVEQDRETTELNPGLVSTMLAGGLPLGNNGYVLKMNFDILDAMKSAINPVEAVLESTLGVKTINAINGYKDKKKEAEAEYFAALKIAALNVNKDDTQGYATKEDDIKRARSNYNHQMAYYNEAIKNEVLNSLPFIGTVIQRANKIQQNLDGIDYTDDLYAQDQTLLTTVAEVLHIPEKVLAAVTPSVFGKFTKRYYYGYGNKGYYTTDYEKYIAVLSDKENPAEAGWAGISRPVEDPTLYYSYYYPASDIVYSGTTEHREASAYYTKDPDKVKYALTHGALPLNDTTEKFVADTKLTVEDLTQVYQYVYPENDYQRKAREKLGKERMVYTSTNSNNVADAFTHGALPYNEDAKKLVRDEGIKLQDLDNPNHPAFKYKFPGYDDMLVTPDAEKAAALYGKGAIPVNDFAEELAKYYEGPIKESRAYQFKYGEDGEVWTTYNPVTIISLLSSGALPVGEETAAIMKQYDIKLADGPLPQIPGKKYYSWHYKGSTEVRASYKEETAIKMMKHGGIPVSDDMKQLQKDKGIKLQNLPPEDGTIYTYRYYGSNVKYTCYKEETAIDLMGHGAIPVSESMQQLQADKHIRLKNLPREPKKGETMYAYHYDGSDITNYVYNEADALDVMTHGGIPENDAMIELYVKRRVLLKNVPREAIKGEPYYTYKYAGSDKLRVTYSEDVAIEVMSHGGIPVSTDMKQLQKAKKITLQNLERPDYTYYKYRYKTEDGFSEVRYTTDKKDALERTQHGAVPFNEAYKKLVEQNYITLANEEDPARPAYKYTYKNSDKVYTSYTKENMLENFQYGAVPVNEAAQKLVQDEKVVLQNLPRPDVRHYSYYYAGKPKTIKETTNLVSAIMAMNNGAIPVSNDMSLLVDTYNEMAKEGGYPTAKEIQKHYEKTYAPRYYSKPNYHPSKSAAAKAMRTTQSSRFKQTSSWIPRATRTYVKPKSMYTLASNDAFLSSVRNIPKPGTPHFYVKKSASARNIGMQLRSASIHRPRDPRILYLAQQGKQAPRYAY